MDYNHAMVAVYLQCQKITGISIGEKEGNKVVHEIYQKTSQCIRSQCTCPSQQSDNLIFRAELVTSLFERYGSTLKTRKQGRLSINPPPTHLTERHFIEKIPATGKKAEKMYCVSEKWKEVGVSLLVSRMQSRLMFRCLFQADRMQGRVMFRYVSRSCMQWETFLNHHQVAKASSK
ncbi:hypothetical protein C0J52_06286 [Blattella germanica]|nr:hypothetical protein C0J52_06286 [Blattella germanica]